MEEMRSMQFEMDKLIAYLYKNVADDHHKIITRPYCGGQQVVVCDADGNWLWDAVSYQYSYGGADGLIEVMEQTDQSYVLSDEEKERDDVLGYLTADDIIKRLES